jgi:hypothetical protein
MIKLAAKPLHVSPRIVQTISKKISFTTIAAAPTLSSMEN